MNRSIQYQRIVGATQRKSGNCVVNCRADRQSQFTAANDAGLEETGGLDRCVHWQGRQRGRPEPPVRLFHAGLDEPTDHAHSEQIPDAGDGGIAGEGVDVGMGHPATKFGESFRGDLSGDNET